jgi:TolA-binding protein
MFSLRFASAGLVFALVWSLAPATAHAQAYGQPMQGGNCSPSRYQMLLMAQLQAQRIQGQAYVLGMAVQGNVYQQSMAYPAAAMQQQMMYNQMALMMNASQYQQQQLQQMNTPPGGPGAAAAAPVAFGPAGFVDPLLRPAAPLAAAPAVAPPVAQQVPARDPFAKPIVVRDIPQVRDPAPVREIMDAAPLRSKEEEAAGKLKLAKLLDRDGFAAKARMRYNEIAEKYPGTKAAEEAEELLAKK